jgi:hypothetical protein
MARQIEEDSLMNPATEFAVRAILIGAGATVLFDLWSLFAARAFALPAANWGLVGRWIGHFPRGQFIHESIVAAPPIPGEVTIGWVAHYAIGIFYGFALLAICGLPWGRDPTLLPALIFSLFALAAPFLIMQPGMGAGIAASRTPHPNAARLRSVAAHTVFGVGLYGTALMLTLLIPN